MSPYFILCMGTLHLLRFPISVIAAFFQSVIQCLARNSQLLGRKAYITSIAEHHVFYDSLFNCLKGFVRESAIIVGGCAIAIR